MPDGLEDDAMKGRVRGATSQKKIANKIMQFSPLLPLLPAVIYVLVLYVFPISKMLVLSFFDPEFTLRHYIHFINVPIYSERLLYSFEIALFVTLLCILLGYPVAYVLTIAGPKLKAILMVMVIIPFFVSTLVRTYAWMILLGRNGIVNNLLLTLGMIDEPIKLMYNTFGVLVGMVHVLLPFTILPIYSVMSGIDRNLVKAAESLGANSFNAFRRVFFPLSLPGVAGSGLLVFIMSLGFYITPALLGGSTEIMVSNLIDQQITKFLEWGFGSAISAILLVVTLIIFYIYNKYLGLDQLLGGSI